MIATAVLIMFAGRLTHLAELNISHVPCVQGDFRAVYSGSCSTNCVGSVPPTCVYIGRVLQPTKILFILPFPKSCVYTWGIDVEMVGIDDRRIATGVLCERMKHITGCDLRLYVDVCKGDQDAARHPVKLLTDRARGRLRRDNTVI